MNFIFGRENGVEFIDFMVDGNMAGFREPVGDGLKGDFEPQAVDLVGAKILRHLPDLGEAVFGRVGVSVEGFVGGVVFLVARGFEGEAVFDHKEILAKAVVKFAGESLAFGFLGFDEFAGQGFLA